MNQSNLGLSGVNARRLFFGSCMSLISTSVAFGVITSMMGDFKSIFLLSSEQAGWVGGAAIWGFTISIFIFGPLVDILGMRRLMRFAMLCHFVGPIIMIKASGFGMLFAGALIIALANGTVEAVCNPLVATIFPDNKTHKLNQFHVWFPGGIVIGGLLSFLIAQLGENFWASMPLAAWQFKLVLILIPTVIYGVVFTGQKFPATERVQSGLSFGDMVKATLFRPLFIVLFICMGLTASLELGPNRWMDDVMKYPLSLTRLGGNAGILILVYGSGLMAILRYCAGPIVHRLSPTGLLLFSGIMGSLGLYSLSQAEGLIMIMISATIFYIGVCYFWPTMLGTAAERIPKGGSLALALLGGWGMAIVGLITAPMMGKIGDSYVHRQLEPQQQAVTQVISQGVPVLAKVKAAATKSNDVLDSSIELVNKVNSKLAAGADLPPVDTAVALRAVVEFAPKPADLEKNPGYTLEDAQVQQAAAQIIKPADNYGGKLSFRWVSSVGIVLVIVFAVMYFRDKARGGYKVEKITAAPAAAQKQPAQKV